MTAENCKSLVPVWASQDEPTPPSGQTPPRFNIQDWFHNFKIKHGITLIVFFAWVATMVAGCMTTGVIVRHNTTERVTREVTSQLRSDFQKFLDDMEADRRKESFLTGEASMEAAAVDLADWMDELIANYSMDYGITPDGCRTIGWVFLARYSKQSSEFGKTPQEIIEKNGAWEGKVAGHAVRNQDTQLALELAREYLAGRYPDGFTTDLTFFNREPGGKIIARNELITGPYTVYWWFGK